MVTWRDKSNAPVSEPNFGLFVALAICLLTLFSRGPAIAATYESSSVVPPKVPREFRGAWIATVANIDWPSKPGLTVSQQKAELLAMLDRAAQLKLNAIVLQVRPECDALYASKIEPWSEYLTGTMGKAPEPIYDPLEFAVSEAHKRGLELHAWFNPYRALDHSSKSPVATNHISRTRPDLVRHYGNQLWLDPGMPDVQDHILRVVSDVVRRYDVDGVHFDDYFYPDPIKGSNGKNVEFPDEASWKRYGASSGLSRDDWRRQNVNSFIQRAYSSINSIKPWVKFGVSPHGIWRPKNPPQIKGSDNYSVIFADSRKWLINGWLDYFSPQLYWPTDKKEQSFTALLDWWDDQNLKSRHIWPGLYTVKVLDDWPPDEIVNQVRFASKQPVSAGHIHYDMKGLMGSSELRSSLAGGPYKEAALVPASPWMGRGVTNKPVVSINGVSSTSLRLDVRTAPGEQVWRWILQTRIGGVWKTEFLPGSPFTRLFGVIRPEVIAVTPIDRYGNAGPPKAVERTVK
jgi:uncharacterized lipoprotein YddW (UPF0748 family)